MEKPMETAKKTAFFIQHLKRSGPYNMAFEHFHDRFELYYLLDGERHYFIQNRIHRVTKGDLVLIDRYALHRTADTGVKHHERILIEFHESFLKCLDEQARKELFAAFQTDRPVVKLTWEEQNQAEALLFQMLKEWDEKKKSCELAVCSLLMQLIILAARASQNVRKKDRERENPGERKIHEVTAYLQRHYTRPLRLEEVARTFGLSTYYLSRMFKKVTGFSFVEYIHLLRVREAQRMLRETGDRVIDIAGRVGFDNIAHFGRVYKKWTGQSPTQYRKSVGSQRPESSQTGGRR